MLYWIVCVCHSKSQYVNTRVALALSAVNLHSQVEAAGQSHTVTLNINIKTPSPSFPTFLCCTRPVVGAILLYRYH